MFQINDDNSIYLTRGDVLAFALTAEGTKISAEDETRTPFKFKADDVLTMKVYAKKDCTDVVFNKDFYVLNDAEIFWIYLTGEDTKIGEVISKPKDYWYEVVLNEKTNPQTIIGYFEDGACLFRLFPEGADAPKTYVNPEDFPDEMLPIYCDFATPSVTRYFMFNTKAETTGDWVLKYVYKAASGTVEKIIVSM